MEILEQLPVTRRRGNRAPGLIQLLAGDLSALPAEHAVDALVVSAFPDSYTPNRGTLFESLYRRGLDMAQVAEHKAEDMRSRLGCWLSEPLPPHLAETFHFRRIICFEPRYPAFVRNTGIDEGNLEDSVGYVFRCLNNFIIPGDDNRRFDIASLAMPLLATGNQGVDVNLMFPHLLEAATFWLEQGLPIDQLKIVAFTPDDVDVARRGVIEARALSRMRITPQQRDAGGSDAADWESRLARTLSRDVIQACTRHLKQDLMRVALDDERAVVERLFDKLERAAPQHPDAASTDVPPAEEYDVFVSYAHTQSEEVKDLVRALEQRVPRPRVFFDRTSIPAGGLWIKMLSDAVQNARTFIAVLSPDYSKSPVCWDEFQCAKLKEYNTRQSVIRTVRLYSEKDLPPIMGIYSYIDCAEGDRQKLRESAAAIVP